MSRHIIIYHGTFDPPHLGHKIIALECLRLLDANVIVIIPTANNPYKPNATDRDHRLAMLKLFFTEPGTLVWEQSKQSALEHFRSEHRSLLLGADSWNHYQYTPASKVQEYDRLIIVSRTGYLLPEVKTFHGIPVVMLQLQYPDTSSTQIRHHLINDPLWYWTPEIIVLDIPVSPQVQRYIQYWKLYILPYLQQQIVNVTHSTNIQLLAGKSGDPIFRIGKAPSFSIVKVFSADRLSIEIRANRIVQSLTSAILWTNIINGIGYLGLEYVSGTDFGSNLQNNPDQVYNIAKQIGTALSELHSHCRPIGNIDKWISKLEQRINAMKVDPLIDEEFRNRLDQYRTNPGDWTYVHGDANPGNFIWTGHKLAMIDFGSMVNSVDENDLPTGYPAYEYYQFIASLTWYATQYPVDESTIRLAILGFREGYDQTLMTSQASRFYELYWDLRTLHLLSTI